MVILVVLILLALVVGLGAVIKGILWLLLIAAIFAIAAVFAGRQFIRNRT